ncbi:J domain-containing protein [uncultured Rhodospira sp.]|uniref:J domain-containing protein n=1 Tax=uncultured Rhodospira sp. TaxID=1936189 RepID=UPI002622071E|nr:J domain-containing protein [uncultured Rhodospira sp.]
MVAHGRKTGARSAATARRRRLDPLLDLDDMAGLGDGFAATPDTPVCDMPGCTKPGEYRAPKDRTLSGYYHFCLEHVRAYNKAWNYCAGMSADEIETHVRTSTIWDRPTWRMGGGLGTGGRHFDPASLDDPLGVFAAARDAEARHAREAATPFANDSREARALRVLDLDWPLTREDLRARYLVLVKRHHPDANGGDKHAEERFKKVSEAYRVLMAALEA